MVIYSASIVTNKRILVSRQFVEMSRGDIEGYLNTFMKGIEQFCLSNEYTFIELENVRYVYQALDNIYLILMTPLNSNIIEDMDTLRLFCQVLYDCCDNPPPLTEELISTNCFDIIFAFDEIISFGYRESVNLSQIKISLEMESQEEKLHKMIRQNKENEEKERRRHIANKLDKERSVHESYNSSVNSFIQMNNNNIVKSSLSGIAAFAESVGVGKFAQSVGISSNKTIISDKQNSNVNSDSTGTKNIQFAVNNSSIENAHSFNAPSKGMHIGKKKPVELISESVPKMSNLNRSEKDTDIQHYSFKPTDFIEDMNSMIEEKTELTISSDGEIQSRLEIQGIFQITIDNDEFPDYSIVEDKRFQFRTHPNLSKEKYQAEGVLALKEGLKSSLPKKTPIPLVKWRLTPNIDYNFELPFSFSCWPLGASDGTTNITIEIESLQTISDINVHIPISNALIQQISTGDFVLISGSYLWKIEKLSPGEIATLEFTSSESNFLPIDLNLVSDSVLCNMEVRKRNEIIKPKCTKTLFKVAVSK
ncbi:delta-COP [Cryptosporidium ryanae]|uniref:delta-COP n=1 Tax=Cryptosporidium ryanae TaxID=515981 RepID=UPI00351A4332|nr:delta-COP [Cryptosporidium ryanae]